VIYGLTAAVMWGTAAVTATFATRKAGTFITLVVGQGVGIVILLVMEAIRRPSFSGVSGGDFLALIGTGLIGLVGYLTFYKALELGPIGLVSAIGATYGGVTAILAFVWLSERLGLAGTTGVALSVLGVTMAAARSAAEPELIALPIGEPAAPITPPVARATDHANGRAGIPLALASALSYGFGGFLLGYFSGRFGWFETAFVARMAAMIALLAALPFFGRPAAWRGTGSGIAWAAAAGVTDVIGVLAFARGGAAGQIAITAAVSSIYPVIPLVAGMALFGEHLSRRQGVGVAVIIVGLVLLGSTAT
jgi:drug/metabolite transporter (DMT)-like permease